MIDKLPSHYSMTNPSSIYDEEALTSLKLAGRTAQKVNECVEVCNETHRHFVENFAENVENSLDDMAESGELETKLVKAVSSGKVDKNGIGQVTYSMLAQDVRDQFTGGNTPVVGSDAVSTANIVDSSIIESKLTGNLKKVWFYPSSINALHTPILKLSNSGFTASINPDFTYTGCKFICRDTLYAIDPTKITVSASYWTSGMASIYFDPSTNVFYVIDVTTTNTITKKCLYLGSMGGDVSDFVIPIEYNGSFFLGGVKKLFRQLPLTTMRVELYEVYPYQPSSALFNIDWETGTVTFLKTDPTKPESKINLPVETMIFTCDFSTATVEVKNHSASGGHLCVYFNPFKNHFLFSPTVITKLPETAHGSWLAVDDYLYLGKVTKPTELNPTLLGKDSCILPHTINNSYYVHPGVKNRPSGKLIIDNNLQGLNSVAVKIDYDNKCMIIPGGCRSFIMNNDHYTTVIGPDGKYLSLNGDYIVPFVDTKYNGTGDYSNQYLIGGPNGIKFVTPTDFKSDLYKHELDGLWYLGYVNVRSKTSYLHCPSERCIKFSILGDSVSTFEGMIPSENVTYYTGSNCGITSYKQTWWGRVADSLGWKVCVNNSWSGSKVSDKTSKGAVIRASKLHTSTETPDVIFFGMGGNDFNQGVELGSMTSGYELDYIRSYNGSNPDFASAYVTTLYTLKKNYPNAKIYTFTFFPSLRCATRYADSSSYSNGCKNVFPPKNVNNISVCELNNIIRKASEICGVECIDLWTAGYTFDNAQQYFGDFISDTTSDNYGFHQHQNVEGMKLWANKVINHVKNIGWCF